MSYGTFQSVDNTMNDFYLIVSLICRTTLSPTNSSYSHNVFYEKQWKGNLKSDSTSWYNTISLRVHWFDKEIKENFCWYLWGNRIHLCFWDFVTRKIHFIGLCFICYCIVYVNIKWYNVYMKPFNTSSNMFSSPCRIQLVS